MNIHFPLNSYYFQSYQVCQVQNPFLGLLITDQNIKIKSAWQTAASGQGAQVFKSCIGCPKVSKQNQSKTICELKLHYRTLVRTGLFYKKKIATGLKNCDIHFDKMYFFFKFYLCVIKTSCRLSIQQAGGWANCSIRLR